MGSWGSGIWDNDYALDWALSFENVDFDQGLDLVTGTIESFSGSQRADLFEEHEFLAAVDTLSVLMGRSSADGIGEEALAWARAHQGKLEPESPVVTAAIQTIERILLDQARRQTDSFDELLSSSEPGDLNAEWDEDGDYPLWAWQLKAIGDALSAMRNA